jgi:hypothetical protein
MGSRTILKPPHVGDMIDDGDENYKSTSWQNPKNIINFNDDDSMTKKPEACNCQLHLQCGMQGKADAS